MSPSLRLSHPLIYGLTALLAGLSLSLSASAQSVNVKKPAPMQPGSNSGTVDNFVGNNYFYFYAGPGVLTVTASYKSMGLLGNAMHSSLNVWVNGMDNSKVAWDHDILLSSFQNAAQKPLTVTLKKPTKIIIAVCPPAGGLIRSGGDYTVMATGGGVRFDKPLSDTELLVGTYTPKLVYDNENTAAKFLPDGTLQFASGTTGTWKLFDADTHLYTVIFGNNRLSLKLVPGRGLVSASDPTSIVFQQIR